jgi:hypothetical protein
MTPLAKMPANEVPKSHRKPAIQVEKYLARG